jgi:hypothetical protein
VDDPGDVAERCGCLDERVNRSARRHIDGSCAHVESGVSHHLRRTVGVPAVQVGQHDLLTGANAPGDRLTDRPCSDNDNDFTHGELLTHGAESGRRDKPARWWDSPKRAARLGQRSEMSPEPGRVTPRA